MFYSHVVAGLDSVVELEQRVVEELWRLEIVIELLVGVPGLVLVDLLVDIEEAFLHVDQRDVQLLLNTYHFWRVRNQYLFRDKGGKSIDIRW